MFERFTESARRAMVLALQEARDARQPQVGPERLLLGVVAAEDGAAGVALASLGVDPARLRGHIDSTHGDGDVAPPGHIPFSDEAKKALEQSLRESLAQDHTYISTEHMLLGLLVADTGVAEILTALGVSPEHARDTVATRLRSAPEPTEP